MKQMTIIGHIGADATTKEVNGNAFVSFSVAVNEKYTKGNTEVESTTWFSCTTKNLNIAPHLKKGDQVMVQGSFKPQLFQDREQNWKVGIDVHAAFIQLLTPKKDEEKETVFNAFNQLVNQAVSKRLNGQPQ